MITATFYQNGYLIKGHARPDICSELSVLAWTATNIMKNIGENGESYSYSHEANAGYGHFTFDTSDEVSCKAFEVTKQMVPIWADKYDWIKDGHIQIINTDETLVLE